MSEAETTSRTLSDAHWLGSDRPGFHEVYRVYWVLSVVRSRKVWIDVVTLPFGTLIFLPFHAW